MPTKIPEKRQPLIDTFIDRNSQINLSAIRDPEDIYVKHILDSLELTKVCNLNELKPMDGGPTNHRHPERNEWMKWANEVEGSRRSWVSKNKPTDIPPVKGVDSSEWNEDLSGGLTLLDLWTGWGFPLLPLAITYPNIHCIGLEARKKKCHAIDKMAATLWLENVLTAWCRAEEYDQQVDIVTARAVSYADKLMHRALPLIKPGGYLIMYKLFTEEEDNLILSLIRQHKLTLTKLHHYHLPDDETQRVLYILKKIEYIRAPLS